MRRSQVASKKQNNTSRHNGEKRRDTRAIGFARPQQQVSSEKFSLAQHSWGLRCIWKMLVGWCLRISAARVINAQKRTERFLGYRKKLFWFMIATKTRRGRAQINWTVKFIEIPLHSDEIITRAELICRSEAWAATNDDEHLFMLISIVCLLFFSWTIEINFIGRQSLWANRLSVSFSFRCDFASF
jgi:hypothetical protein